MGEEGEARLNRDAVYFSIHEVEKKKRRIDLSSMNRGGVGGNYSQRRSTFPAIFTDWYAVSNRAACALMIRASVCTSPIYTYVCTVLVCISVSIYIYIHIYTIFLNNTRVWEADRWRWRVVGVKATTGADLNPRPGRWKGSNKSCTRDEDESENTENRPLCRATLCNYFVERRFLHTIPRRTEESVTSTNTKT